MNRVYFDHHATTPVDPRVVDAMLPYLREEFGNASSKTHAFGWTAQEAVETARKHVAKMLGASTKEIIFTSGATESNNIAIHGLAATVMTPTGPKGRDHIITQSTEHHAVLDPVRELEKRGFRVTVITPDSEGIVSA